MAVSRFTTGCYAGGSSCYIDGVRAAGFAPTILRGTRRLLATSTVTCTAYEAQDNLLSYVTSDDNVAVKDLLKDLSLRGILQDDPRLSSLVKLMETKSEMKLSDITNSDSHQLIDKSLKRQLIIPDFEQMSTSISDLHSECYHIHGGQNASYIPELARIDPSLWSVSVCTVDGQRYSVGDMESLFTIQSAGKCLNYAIGCDVIGTDQVHEYVGMEPSGSHFNRMVLNAKDKPHNPMINSGAIVLCSLIYPHLSIHERMNLMLGKFDELAGAPKRSIKCDMITCDSEMDNCEKNMALIYYMKSKNSFPMNMSVDNTIKFYTRLCSIEINTQRGAVMASTLANQGICPLTNKKVISKESVRHCLTLMHSCGMYDYSGEFAFNVGLPAKSGVSGVILVVVPGVMGLCLYSPPVNANGNSVRGLEFCRLLTKTFGFHIYDNQFQYKSNIK